MTTGHAPDDWLDIPPPDFGPGTDPDGDGSVIAAETAVGSDLPTGELQVVDVADAEHEVGGVPTGKLPALDVPEPDGPGEGAAGTPAAVPGDVDVDVAGVVEVPEPPAPNDWRVPVLRPRRTPPTPAAPPDATPDRPAEPEAPIQTAEPAQADGAATSVAAATSAETSGPADTAEPVVAAGVAERTDTAGAAGGGGGDVAGGDVGTRDAEPGVGEASPEAETAPAPGGLGGELGPRARRRIEAHRYRARKVRRQRRLAVVGLAVLVGTGTALGLVGVAKVRGSTGGRYIDPQVRPDEPGYVALVTPTPTLLVVHKGSGGALSGVSLLSLHAQDEGGSVIVMPVTTVAPFADAGTTFADAYAENGAEGVKTQVELTLNVAIGETVEVDDARWAALVGPVAPIPVELDTGVGEWPAGEADIPARQVGTFLTTRDDGETELARLDRQELFWESWLPLVRSGGRNAVPGEVDVGLGRFVRALAAGDTDVVGLPVSAAFSAEEMYGPTEEMLPDLVADAVPYPQEPSRGSRVQIQLLNGTGQRDLTTQAATLLVSGGAEIALVGNAGSFTEPTTRFVYATAKLRDDAEKLRDAFGVGEVVQAPADEGAAPVDDDRIDVTVILGADALDVAGG